MDYNGYTQSFNTNSFNNLNTLNQTIHIQDDKAQVLRWLSSLEPRKRHRHLRDSRLKGVGQWIFQTAEFQRWNMGDDGPSHSVLFCHGGPGVGKTHLSSLVMDYFYCRRQDVTVAGLYCDYLSRNEQTISNMLGALLKQLVGRGNIPEDIRQAFEDAKGHLGGVGLEVSELLKMLEAAIAQRQWVVICIDGLDESLAAHRTSLLSSLQTTIQKSPNLRLFLTGRPFIRGEVEKCFPSVNTISISPTKEDIEAFLKTKLDGDTEPDAMDERLKADIMEIIPKKISEIFLLVSLSIEAILGETTIHRREEKLKQISKGQDIGDLYTATLSRIKAQKPDRSRLGMEAIMWVAYSERPLRPEELCEALGVEIGSQDLNSRNVPSIQTILSCGLGLVTVDSSSSTVRLVHFTLQEYILANSTLFSAPHSAIAEVCLTYLNSACIRDLSPALSSPPPTTPFLEYASCYWGAHARREIDESVISLALKLLDQFDEHISCKLLTAKEYRQSCYFDIQGKPTGFTGLHGGAFFGLVEIMISLFGHKRWDPNATDFEGSTALARAAVRGHDGAVKMLLDRKEVNPNLRDKFGQTPLHYATIYGHEKIVKRLLERNDLNPNIGDNRSETPFLCAVGEGHSRIVNLLLERNDVNPDMADRDGLTPLAWAIRSGVGDIAVTLLERSDVDPEAADVNGRTPFSWAASSGETGFLEILLELGDVNPDRADRNGRTPLSWAAEEWDVETVEMLLERNDVNPNTPDKRGRTPLSLAAGNGCKEIAEIILKRTDVNPDTPDESGRTPLAWAAKLGKGRVVKMLLERSDVNPGMVDNSGQTPSSLAAMSGHEEIVDMLLGSNNLNPDSRDETSGTPFPWAAGGSQVGIPGVLFEQNNANPDTHESGQTLFSEAIVNGHAVTTRLQDGRHDLTTNSVLRGESFQFFTTKPPELLEPPLKKFRRS